MFYRIRFDGYVGGILKRCHFDTSETLSFWPLGATEEWVPRGQNLRLKPAEAAALAVAEVALQRCEAGQITGFVAQYIASQADAVARENNARHEVLSESAEITYNKIPIASKNKTKR